MKKKLNTGANSNKVEVMKYHQGLDEYDPI